MKLRLGTPGFQSLGRTTPLHGLDYGAQSRLVFAATFREARLPALFERGSPPFLDSRLPSFLTTGGTPFGTTLCTPGLPSLRQSGGTALIKANELSVGVPLFEPQAAALFQADCGALLEAGGASLADTCGSAGFQASTSADAAPQAKTGSGADEQRDDRGKEGIHGVDLGKGCYTGTNLRTGPRSGQRRSAPEVAGSANECLPSPVVNRDRELRRLLKASSDRDNPSPEALAALLQDVQHIAVVGLSRYLEKAARRVPSYLAAKGFDVIPVNPSAERLLGRRSYPTLAEVEEPVDLVLIFRPSAVAAEIVEAALNRPEKPAIWLQTGVVANDAATAARSAGRTVVQDLCIFRVHRVLIA